MRDSTRASKMHLLVANCETLDPPSGGDRAIPWRRSGGCRCPEVPMAPGATHRRSRAGVGPCLTRSGDSGHPRRGGDAPTGTDPAQPSRPGAPAAARCARAVLGVLVLAAASTGLRQSELLGLRWRAPGLRVKLSPMPGLITPVERQRHPSVVSLAVVAQPPAAMVATALVADGGVTAYALQIVLRAGTAGWSAVSTAGERHRCRS